MAGSGKNPNSLKNLKPFKPGHIPTHKRGRIASSLKSVINRDNGITREHVRNILRELCFGKTKEEIKEMLKDPKLSAVEYGIISAFLKDCIRGSSYTINMIFTWIFGKPEQPIELSGGLGISDMSPDEIDAAIKKYIEELGYVKTDNSTDAENTGTDAGNTIKEINNA